MQPIRTFSVPVWIAGNSDKEKELSSFPMGRVLLEAHISYEQECLIPRTPPTPPFPHIPPLRHCMMPTITCYRGWVGAPTMTLIPSDLWGFCFVQVFCNLNNEKMSQHIVCMYKYIPACGCVKALHVLGCAVRWKGHNFMPLITCSCLDHTWDSNWRDRGCAPYLGMGALALVKVDNSYAVYALTCIWSSELSRQNFSSFIA